MKPKKYINAHLNIDYVSYLENKLNAVKSAVRLAEGFIADQSNGLTDDLVCISALKDIRKHIRGV